MKTKLFSITASDCRWVAKRGSGKGGQKRNKTSNAIQCFHDPSGAMGEAEDLRDQSLNRRKAFERMTQTKEFQSWMNLKIAAAKGEVEIEYKDAKGFDVKRPLEMAEV